MQKHHVGLRDAAVAIVTGHFHLKVGWWTAESTERTGLCVSSWAVGAAGTACSSPQLDSTIFAGLQSCIPKLTAALGLVVTIAPRRTPLQAEKTFSEAGLSKSVHLTKEIIF